MMMEMNGIKRIPILRDGELVGLLSRANLVRPLGLCSNCLEVAITAQRIAAVQRYKWLSEFDPFG